MVDQPDWVFGPGTGDFYLYSLTPVSASVVGPPFFSPGDIIASTVAGPVVAASATSLGLLPTDDLDAMICHDMDADGDLDPDIFDVDTDLDGLPDMLDAEDDGDAYMDDVEDGTPLCAGAVNHDAFDDLLVNDGCPAVGLDEVSAGGACGTPADEDGDGSANDGCPQVGMWAEGAQCGNGVNDDSFEDAAVNDGCPARFGAEAAVDCGDALDSDGDGYINDGCPPVGAGPVSESPFHISTSRTGPCSVGAAPAPSPSWPSDTNSAAVPPSVDRISITDLTAFLAPLPRAFGSSPPGAPPVAGTLYNARFDMIPGITIGPAWITIDDLVMLFAGPTGTPPMFGGAPAFNGPACVGP
jgi:hypothetical protein